jgi:PhzF family phenazine biosynthesis protein
MRYNIPMSSITVLHYDSFSRIPNMGNPAGVVLDGDGLDDDQMQAIATKVGFSETTFALPSRKADFRFRFFTPGYEIDLCGHGSVGTLAGIFERSGLINGEGPLSHKEWTIETKAGLLPMSAEDAHGAVRVTMRQASPKFMPFDGNVDELARSLGLGAVDLEPELPVVYGSTGTWTLLVPLRSLESFSRMRPRNDRFPQILTTMPNASVHAFCLETHDPEADMHGRHFAPPRSGLVEDPVTGTASGVMGAYYVRYIAPTAANGARGAVRWEDPHVHHICVEQGREIGRDGRVGVTVDQRSGNTRVSITGDVVYVGEMQVDVNRSLASG